MRAVILSFTFAVIFLTLGADMGFAQQPLDLTTVGPSTSVPLPGQAVVPAAVTTTTSPSPSVQQAPSDQFKIPDWAIGILKAAQKFPTIGPVISQIMMYIGILGGILTSAILFLLGVLRSLSGIAWFTNAASLAQKLKNFQNSKFMMWLLAFSNVPMAHPSDVSDMKKEAAADTVKSA